MGGALGNGDNLCQHEKQHSIAHHSLIIVEFFIGITAEKSFKEDSTVALSVFAGSCSYP